MKKMLIGLFAVLLAAGTVFAVEANHPKMAFDPSYHWFDDQGTYLGFLTESSQRAICDANTSIVCRNGYTEIDFDEDGNEVPAGVLMVPLKKTN
ncbi:MAG TPA: hypothetical protein VF145_13870 [Chitinophagaceae bacterium]